MRGRQRHHRHLRGHIRTARGGEADGGVGIEDLTGAAGRPGHCLCHFARVDPVAGEQFARALLLRIGEAHRPARLEPAHLFRQRRAVAARQIEQQPFEVRTDLNIHAGRGGRRHRAGRIIARRQRAVEDVVDIGRDDQPFDRQAHARGDIAREHIAEIAGRHAERHRAVRRAEAHGGVEIIDHLRHQPRPVDRIDRRHLEPPGETGVVEHRLYHRLRVVEAALDGDIVDVGRQHGRHLSPLHIADPPARVEHEDVDPLTPRHRVDRGGAGIAAGRADDRQMPVGARDEAFEEQPEQLQRDILERQRRPVEQFEQEVAMVELDQRRHRVMAEPAIGGGAQVAQLRFAERVADERLHHPHGGFDIGQARQVRDLVRAHRRPFDRDIKAAVAGEARQRDVAEIEFGRGAARALVTHGAAG